MTRRHRSDTRIPVCRAVALAAIVPAVLAASVGCADERPATSERSTTTTEPVAFSGYVQSPARQVDGVTLPDVDGAAVRMVAPPGGFRIVYFGYTHCPDVCPATMSFVKTALASLPEDQRDRITVDMITVDPSRDTADVLRKYVKAFVPDGNAIRTPDDVKLRSAADAFGANYEVTTTAEGEVEVSHSGDLFVVDDAGAVVLAWPFGITPKAIERDLTRILDGERPSAD